MSHDDTLICAAENHLRSLLSNSEIDDLMRSTTGFFVDYERDEYDLPIIDRPTLTLKVKSENVVRDYHPATTTPFKVGERVVGLRFASE